MKNIRLQHIRLQHITCFLLKLVLCISSTSLMPVIYLVKSNIYIIEFASPFANHFINIVFYLFIVLLLYFLSKFLFSKMDKDSINNDIQDIRIVDNEYLPIYLAYFFVALSIPTVDDLSQNMFLILFIYLLICVFLIFSKTLSFNPIFVIFGYSYYLVKTHNGKAIFVLTKKKIGKNTTNITFPHLTKISEIEYFDTDN